MNSDQIILFHNSSYSNDSDSHSEEVHEPKRSGIFSRFFPDGFSNEAKEILRLTFPIALTSVITFIMGPISTLFCGHYHSGRDSLALPVVGSAVSVFNVFGMVFPTGMLTACDTFFAQTYGSKDKTRMGIQFQRAFIIAFLICLPSFTMFLCVQPILLMLKQPPNVVKLVDDYLLYMYPGFVGASLTIVFQKFVQAQNFVYGPLVIGFTSNSINAILHYLLLYRFDVGLKGSAISQSISYWINVVMYLGYFIMNKFHKKYSFRFKKESLSDWDKWFALAIPGLIMIGLEWWIFEIGTFIAGSFGQLQLASQTIIFQLETIAFTSVPFGFGIAASIRTGQALGSGNVRGPVSTKNVGIFVCWCFTLIFITLFTVFRKYMPMIFSDDEKVIEYTSNILPLLAIFQFFDAFIGVCGGVVRGSGIQYIGAAICIIGLYVFALPISIALIKLTDLSIAGYWISLCIGTVIEGIAYLIISARINWPRQVELAAKRCAISTLENENKSDERNNFRKILLNRFILVACFVGVLCFGLIIRNKLNLRKTFGVYCIFKNDTYVQIPWYNDNQPIPFIPQNCTLFYP